MTKTVKFNTSETYFQDTKERVIIKEGLLKLMHKTWKEISQESVDGIISSITNSHCLEKM